jgi:AcrR family transcriptional regulator
VATADTKEQLLDAAEDLFAEHGFAATSLRELTARAGANVAAVNYHFGGKDNLAKAVLARRIGPINDERRRRLDALGPAATVEQIVRAFVEPILRAPSAPGVPVLPLHRLSRLFGHLLVEQPTFLQDFLRAQFGALGRRFVEAIGRAVPGVPAATAWWRLHFTVGALAHTLQNAEPLRRISGGACDANDTDTLLEQLVAFAAGGIPAQSPQSSLRTKPRRPKPRRSRS